jgi:hypothetical protein
MKEIKSKEVIFNRQLVRFLMLTIIGAAVIFNEFYFYEEDHELYFLVIGIPLTVINLVIILISPIYYVFGENELVINYFWGLKEIIPYNKLKITISN